MVRCWKCGRENDEGMRFCTNCGTPIQPAQGGGAGAGGGGAAAGATGFDPAQSETISFNAPTQTSTGRGATPTSPYTMPAGAPSYTETTPKSRTGMVVGILAGVLLLGILSVGGVAAYYYFSNRSEVATDNTNKKEGNLEQDKKPANANASPASEPSPTPAAKPSFDPPTVATKEGSFTVYANEGWQLSEIDVVPLEKFTTMVAGIVDIAEVKTGVRAGGVSDAKFKSRRLYSEFPVGALLMRTRYADGRFSNMVAAGVNGNWENLPDERGRLEFIINDNSPKDNGGQFTIKVKMTSVPKK
jgi:hypothetical protein